LSAVSDKGGGGGDVEEVNVSMGRLMVRLHLLELSLLAALLLALADLVLMLAGTGAGELYGLLLLEGLCLPSLAVPKHVVVTGIDSALSAYKLLPCLWLHAFAGFTGLVGMSC
jgi:hypothetical protein